MLMKLVTLMLLFGLPIAYAANASVLPNLAAEDTSARINSTPEVSSPTEGKLATAVRLALGKANEMDASRIAVTAHAGTVTLLGSAPDQQQIDRAQQLAESVSGVKNVINHLVMIAPGRGS
ncbi:BON domain-containing protein [Burkholderia cepacia]|uniref:BON domain-containing protein n=1 Tax=Burkholderia cepacia TaxID=292 RepID=UPI0009BF4F1F|nr:BON domain-containing protein [Burkholderia cepacia]